MSDNQHDKHDSKIDNVESNQVYDNANQSLVKDAYAGNTAMQQSKTEASDAANSSLPKANINNDFIDFGPVSKASDGSHQTMRKNAEGGHYAERYDANGRLTNTESVDKDGNSVNTQIKENGDRDTNRFDKDGNRTHNEYKFNDGSGRQVNTTYGADGSRESRVYGPNEQLQKSEQVRGDQSVNTDYNQDGSRFSRHYQNGELRDTEYKSSDNSSINTHYGQDGSVTTRRFNAQGEQVR